MIKYILCSILLTGCASVNVQKAAYMCGEPARAYRNGSQPVPDYDRVNEEGAQKGCIKFYGPTSCLITFIKTGPDSYYAICRRNQ